LLFNVQLWPRRATRNPLHGCLARGSWCHHSNPRGRPSDHWSRACGGGGTTREPWIEQSGRARGYCASEHRRERHIAKNHYGTAGVASRGRRWRRVALCLHLHRPSRRVQGYHKVHRPSHSRDAGERDQRSCPTAKRSLAAICACTDSERLRFSSNSKTCHQCHHATWCSATKLPRPASWNSLSRGPAGE